MPREPRLEVVLESAAELFSAHGFSATSVRQVAERARLTKAGLYYHIREKEDLLFRICEHSISTILEGARAALAAARGPRARLSALVHNHTDFFWAHPHNLAVLNRDMGALSPAPRAAIMGLEREYLDLIRGVVREGQAEGVVKPIDPTVAAFALLTVLNNLYVWYRPEGRIPPAELVSQIEDILFNGLLSGERDGADSGGEHD